MPSAPRAVKTTNETEFLAQAQARSFHYKFKFPLQKARRGAVFSSVYFSPRMQVKKKAKLISHCN